MYTDKQLVSAQLSKYKGGIFRHKFEYEPRPNYPPDCIKLEVQPLSNEDEFKTVKPPDYEIKHICLRYLDSKEIRAMFEINQCRMPLKVASRNERFEYNRAEAENILSNLAYTLDPHKPILFDWNKKLVYIE